MSRLKLVFSILLLSTVVCVIALQSEHRDSSIIKMNQAVQKKLITLPQYKIVKHQALPTRSQSILKILNIDAKEIGSLTQKEFKKISQTITPVELFEIKKIALSLNESNEKRQASIFILSHIGHVATDSLAEIIQTKIPELKNTHSPHSIDNSLHANEVALRITALEALDNLAIENPEVRNNIENIIKNQKNPELNYLAQISLSGILTNRPGKIKRVINAMLAERNNS